MPRSSQWDCALGLNGGSSGSVMLLGSGRGHVCRSDESGLIQGWYGWSMEASEFRAAALTISARTKDNKKMLVATFNMKCNGGSHKFRVPQTTSSQTRVREKQIIVKKIPSTQEDRPVLQLSLRRILTLDFSDECAVRVLNPVQTANIILVIGGQSSRHSGQLTMTVMPPCLRTLQRVSGIGRVPALASM